MTPLRTRRDHELDLARNLARDLDRTRHIARNLARDFSYTRDRTLDRAVVLEYVRTLDRELHHAHDLALFLARELDQDLAQGFARDLAQGFARDLAHELARGLESTRGLALVFARELDQGYDRRFTIDQARALTGALNHVWGWADDLVTGLERLVPAANAEAGDRLAVRPVRAARGLAHAAARILPAAHRGRYREEYHSELYELAAAKTPRWAQLLYALRLLDRAWVLRAELRAPTAEQARS